MTVSISSGRGLARPILWSLLVLFLAYPAYRLIFWLGTRFGEMSFTDYEAALSNSLSLGSILINAIAASSMVKFAGLGHAGLALSTSLVALFSSTVLFEVLRRRIGGIEGRRLFASFSQIVVAAGVMGVACALSSRAVEHWLGLSRLARVADLAISVPLGLVVFYITCKMFGLPEMDSARRALIAPLTRRFGPARVKIL